MIVLMRSHYTDEESLSRPAKQFEKWLQSQNYESVTEMYPAAVQAVALVDDYFQEYPERGGFRSTVTSHAEAIGWISDYQDQEDDEEGPDPDGPDRW